MGAVHKVGDTWTPLDASFKQYVYTNGMDLATAVPFDAEALVGDIVNSATVNEAEGWVTGVDSGLINAAMADYRAEVDAYMTANHPDATVGDVLGYKRIEEQVLPIFPGTLPNTHIATSTRMSALADVHRHRLSFTVEPTSAFYYVEPFSITYALPELAGRKITLSYSPATQADEDVINSFLPAPHADGTPIDPSELPTSLPAYMINLKPELRVDGAVVATGGAIGMGSAENVKMAFHDPTRGTDVVSNVIEAGEYWGIAVIGGGISVGQVGGIKEYLNASISGDTLSGSILFATGLFYFTELNALDYLLSKTLGVHSIRLPSEAIVSSNLTVSVSFGIPILVGRGAMSIDVDRILSIDMAERSHDEIYFREASGTISSMLEHSVPEQILSPSNSPTYAISAVKALRIAGQQGVPIFTINKDNLNKYIPMLEVHSSVIQDVQNAVNAGMEVIIARSDIQFNGWSGCGYIIHDPTTGAGSYMISGGLSGGWIQYLWVAGSQCKKSYLERVIDNFLLTNKTLPGLMAPVGVSLISAGAVADLCGTLTLGKWILSHGLKGAILEGVAFTGLETGILAIATTIYNFILAGLAFEVGVFIGSLVSATFTCIIEE
jgi:hypothetical protein